MKLWMSAEAWIDVSDTYRKARNQIEEAVNRALSDRDYGKGVRKWAFLAIMLPPDIQQDYPEVYKYHKSDKSVEFRLRVDLEAFKAGDESTHKRLICEALLHSLNMLDEKSLPYFDHKQLRSDFQSLAKQHGWLCTG